MTLSAAVTAVLRDEVARTSRYAVSKRTLIAPTTILHWLRGRVGFADVIDATVATYGLAPIVARLGSDARIALYGACETCHARPKASRGLLRQCRSCRRLTGLRAQAGEGVPS